MVEEEAPAAGRMAKSHWLEGTTVFVAPATPLELKAAEPTEASLLSRLSGVPTKDQKEVVDDACLLVDAGKIESEADAANFLASQGKGPAAYRSTAFGLAQELHNAKTSGQRTRIIAQAVICELASN